MKKFTVSSDKELASVAFYNLAGQLVLKQDSNQKATTVQVGQLVGSLYFIKAITKEAKVVTQKIVIEQ
ncbi:MAG: hypothetical protein ACI9XO_002620 [Paraglaciecola sp.]|jgi:hypothetical protein